MDVIVTNADVQSHLKSLTVLIVDDDEFTLDLSRELLSRFVKVVITANNGEEGLEAYRNHTPDLVITDIQMPIMDGLEMIREIRSFDNHKQVPIFLMTGFDHPDYLKHAIKLGVHEYVLKPLNVDMFIGSLQGCARRLLAEKIHEKTREELVISRNMYAELFDYAPIAYFIFDPQGIIKEANSIAVRLLGIEKGLLIDTPFESYIASGNNKELFSHHLESVLQSKEMQRCVINLVGADATEIFGQLQSVAVRTEKSGSIRILSSIVDGTIGEHLTNEVKGALEYAENIVETVREPLVVLNSELKILTANHSFYETFKVVPEETVGNFIYDVGNRQWDIPALRVLFEEILPHDTVFNGYEVEHNFPGIGRKTILLNAREVFSKNKDSRIILLAMEDITERKKLETEIQDALEYAENIVEAVREPLVVLNADLKILTANHSFYGTFRVAPEETVGNFIYDVGNRQWDIPALRILFEEILPLDTVINGYEVEHDFLGIGRKIILLNARQIFRSEVGSHIILLAMEDITERKHTETVLHQHQVQLQALNEDLEKRVNEEVAKNREKDIILLHADKMSLIGQLAAGVAHEINNPIAFIVSNLVTLKRYVGTFHEFFKSVERLIKIDGGDERERLFGEAIENQNILSILDDIDPLIAESSEGADRVKQIVKDLKSFARMDDGVFQWYDLNDCIRSTLNLVRNEIKYDSELTLQLGEIPDVNCSRHQISQVILNLLVNAAHSIKKQGSITVTTTKERDYVLLTVRDNGCGMPEEVRNRIFEPFYTTKEVGKGTGLGLSISYSIIQKHHGEILVESEPGVGTIFTVKLPINSGKELLL